jgi:hypothetical protein
VVARDTHTIQALNAAGQSVTGLTWTSSDTTVVGLSTDDPPILTALAAGHVTITAGGASADVTVVAGALPLGTVLWSNPGTGGGVSRIVPAVPSASGVADVFAFQNDGTVQAITSDGITAWTANIGQNVALPDFQGGLIVSGGDGNNGTNIFKLDGITGQAYPAYNLGPSLDSAAMGVHTDGTIFTIKSSCTVSPDPPDLGECTVSVIGIDPIAGAEKFSVPFVIPRSTPYLVQGGMIAGDGYYYVAFITADSFGGAPDFWQTNDLTLLRVNSAGASDVFNRFIEWTNQAASQDSWVGQVALITNADTGILLTLATNDGNPPYFVTTTGTGFSAVRGPALPGRTDTAVPILQAQDGSFVGTYDDLDTNQTNMIAFDATGNVRWSAPNEQPQIATADGGVIGQSGITYDQNGNATGQIANLPTYSWTLNAYRLGSVEQLASNPVYYALSWWAVQGANVSQSKTAAHQDYYRLRSCPGASTPCPQEAILAALGALRSLLGGSQCTSCTGNVFSKLPGYDQMSFFNYLSRQPRLWDGTQSYVPQHVGLCPSGFFNQFLCPFPAGDSLTVRDYLLSQGSDAVSQTPSDTGKGMQIFFNPGIGICNVLPSPHPGAGDQGVLNQATLFHEALHGYTGYDDASLRSKLNPPIVTGESVDISYYLMRQVIPGGAQGATTCGN